MGHVESVDFFLMVILHFVMRKRFVKEGSIKTPVLLRFMSVKPQKRKKTSLTSLWSLRSLTSVKFMDLYTFIARKFYTKSERSKRPQ